MHANAQVYTMDQDNHVRVKSLAPLDRLLSQHCAIDAISLRALQVRWWCVSD